MNASVANKASRHQEEKRKCEVANCDNLQIFFSRLQTVASQADLITLRTLRSHYFKRVARRHAPKGNDQRNGLTYKHNCELKTGSVQHPYLHVSETVVAVAAATEVVLTRHVGILKCIGNGKHDGVGGSQQKRNKHGGDSTNHLTLQTATDINSMLQMLQGCCIGTMRL